MMKYGQFKFTIEVIKSRTEAIERQFSSLFFQNTEIKKGQKYVCEIENGDEQYTSLQIFFFKGEVDSSQGPRFLIRCSSSQELVWK